MTPTLPTTMRGRPGGFGTLGKPTGIRASKNAAGVGSMARRLLAFCVFLGGSDVPRMTSYARETRALVDDLALFPLEWDITGSGHIQPFRLRPDGTRTPIHNGFGQPIVGSSSPRNEKAARTKFLHDLQAAGVIKQSFAKRRKRVAASRPMAERPYGELLEFVQKNATKQQLVEFAERLRRAA